MKNLLIVSPDAQLILQLKTMIASERLEYAVIDETDSVIKAIESLDAASVEVVIIDERAREIYRLAEELNIRQNIITIVISDYAGIFRDNGRMDHMMYEYIYRPVEDSKLLNILRRESMESFAEQKFRVFTEMRLNKLKQQFLKNISSNNAYFRTKLLWEINDEYEMNMSEGRFNIGLVVLDGKDGREEKETSAVLFHIILDIFSSSIPAGEFAVYQFRKYFLVVLNNVYDFQEFLDMEQKICEAVIEVHPEMKYTITVPHTCTSIYRLDEYIEEALYICRNRILVGTDRIIRWSDLNHKSDHWNDNYTVEEKSRLNNILDVCDMEMFGIWYVHKVENIQMYGEGAVDFAYAMAEEFYIQFERRMYKSNLISIETWAEISKEYYELKDSCGTLNDLLDWIYLFACRYLSKIKILMQRPDERIYLAQKYINQHYSEEITLEDIAKAVNLTPNYLCDLYKKKTQKTLVQYMNYYRVERAKEILEETDLKVNEIAPLIGYADEKYFSRVFKQYVGVSPGSYRKCSNKKS